MTVQSVDVIESFYPLREDIEKLSLCVYFADLTYALLNQNSADEAGGNRCIIRHCATSPGEMMC